ncbi:transposase [Burkholderia territorii]|uniref:Transposase n=1 Tax=Burkholderia territorii TaxID=1503055 RepID=A0A119VJ37_9BURK|nr:transposase [Burkholderia territorii]
MAPSRCLPRVLTQYTKEFKVEAVRLTGSVGQHEASRRLACRWRRWELCRNQRDGSAQAATELALTAPSSSRRPVSDLEAENSRLRKELVSAKLDIELLRKATAYFAKGSR